jgi:hypothetical protein
VQSSESFTNRSNVDPDDEPKSQTSDRPTFRI